MYGKTTVRVHVWRARDHPFSIKLLRRVWVAIFAFSAAPVQIGTWCVGSLVKACCLSRDCENSKKRAQSLTIQDSAQKLTSLRKDKLTELVVVEFLLTMQPHGHVAYYSFTRWLRVSRHKFQYVAPTHDDAARSMAAPVPLDAFMAILWFTKLSSTRVGSAVHTVCTTDNKKATTHGLRVCSRTGCCAETPPEYRHNYSRVSN